MVKKTESSCAKKKLIRGAWTAEEDRILADYVKIHGDKKWRSLPANAGLNRCGKSCRLRWMNYLRPGIKRGNISEDEEDLIIRLHNLIGNRWSLIAGRLPGRTDNEIKNHWNTHLSRKSLSIDELNLKLNQKLETRVDCSSSCSTISTTELNWDQQILHPSLKPEGSDDALFASMEPCESDFGMEMDRFLEFSHESNEFGLGEGNFYEGEEEGMLQNCLNDQKLEESNGGFLMDQDVMYPQLDFDTLAQLLECEDNDAFLSF